MEDEGKSGVHSGVLSLLFPYRCNNIVFFTASTKTKNFVNHFTSNKRLIYNTVSRCKILVSDLKRKSLRLELLRRTVTETSCIFL